VPSECSVQVDFTPVSCTLLIRSISDAGEIAPGGLTAPDSGVITRWRVDSGAHTATSLVFKPRVIRFTTFYTMISTGTARTIPSGGGTLTFDERLPVEQGAIFAIDSLANGPFGAGPRVVANIASDARYTAKTPAVADGLSFPVSIVIGPSPQTKLLINADVEPDADRDGYGDESQDLCPGRADLQTACPAPGITAKLKAVKNGFTVSIDRAASADITLEKVTRGRRTGKKCKRSARRGKRCDIFTKFAQWQQDLATGSNKVSFAYRVGGPRIKKGNYRANITLTNAENKTTRGSFRFKVKK
jgi:hypothetical protein